ncbi:MAG: response regulator [Candidatus Humimicrobiaceae bacterium]|jgi:DNA-binding response OmpR family regulator|nr:response regulator [Actinomycetota bacterium]MDD5600194.1 response regulator [Actinomycetota bacterium]MDY0028300.1 response regulator [Candidatus Humimicrobiaceae bacterium]
MKNKKILIADDEPYILRSLSFVLKKEGFDVDTAKDGKETLEKVSRFKPKILFLDVMMPEKDGYQICKQLKSNDATRDIYIIMLTARGQIIDKKKGIESGADEYITKPFSPREIVSKVRSILES